MNNSQLSCSQLPAEPMLVRHHAIFSVIPLYVILYAVTCMSLVVETKISVDIAARRPNVIRPFWRRVQKSSAAQLLSA